MVQLTARRLEREETAAAYALVRSAAPGVTLDQWTGFAGRLAGQGGGVIGVDAAGGPLIGIAAYRTDLSLVHGRLLRVELLAAFELRRSAPVRTALLEALEVAAREAGCSAIGLALNAQGAAMPAPGRIETWQALGYRAGPLQLVRDLPRDADDRPRAACAA